MKKKLFLFIIVLLVNQVLMAQVAINTTGESAISSAVLDVSSTSAGLLIPRMLSTQRLAIDLPADGLLVFDTSTGSFWYYISSTWHQINFDGAIVDADGDTKIQVEESLDEDVIRFDIGGNEYFTMSGPRLYTMNNGNSVFIGESAGSVDDLSDNENTFIGFEAGKTNTTGYRNVAMGFQALESSTSVNDNVAIGYLSLSNTTSGINTAVGYKALMVSSGGDDNTAIGYRTLEANTTGHDNTAVGDLSLNDNTSGYNNTALGSWTLYKNTLGFSNCAFGYYALSENTTGDYNIAIGEKSLYHNTASYNTAIGHESMLVNTSGENNTAVGYQSLNDNLAVDENTAMGAKSAYNTRTGGFNSAFGSSAMYTNYSGNYNSAFGQHSLYYNNSGNYNTATGCQAMYKTTSGYNNTAVGYKAMWDNTTGDYNTAIGYDAGPGSSYSNLTNSTALGRGATNTSSNQVRIGNSSVGSIGGYQPWSLLSDGRFKKQIRHDKVVGLDFILKLQPVTYQLDILALDKFLGKENQENNTKEVADSYQSGFIAQQVEAAANETGYEFSGIDAPKNDNDHYSLRYSMFVVPLVKAVQEQQQMIDEQNSTIEKLVKRLEVLENTKYIKR